MQSNFFLIQTTKKCSHFPENRHAAMAEEPMAVEDKPSAHGQNFPFKDRNNAWKSLVGRTILLSLVNL
jgi:hypothetical protein